MRMKGISPNLWLTIDQISQLSGVSKSTLRYWEKSFQEFLQPARSSSNRREYSLEDLDLVQTIKRLLDHEHLTARGARLRLGETLTTGRDYHGQRLTSA
jgi:hypothetical protein